MSNVICTDDRFEVIAKYKAELLDKTNIKTSADEMAVIDNILFRMWQMGWLDRLEQPTVDAVQVVRCENCKWCAYPVPNSTKYGCKLFDRCVKHDWFCADGERKDGADDERTD